MEYWTRPRFQPGLPLDGRETRITAGPEHRRLAREAAAEGMVLLKNEGELLPFAPGSRLAVFGAAQADYVYGGGGSGEVFPPYVVSPYEGLCQKEAEGKLRLFHELSGFYETAVRQARDQGINRGEAPEPSVPEDLLDRARSFTDQALLCLSRYSEEGWDLSPDPKAGEYYLSQGERDLVEAVCSRFSRVTLLLNVGTVVDTSWFCRESRIQGVLCMWQGGMEGGAAAADLLCGDRTPSGKLADTLAADLWDYPSTEGFGHAERFVDYTEDIYVGYRYFETLPGARDRVNYEFGFGLSYTTFSLEEPRLICGSQEISLQVLVRNTGRRPGKEVVQLYYSAPQGRLGKPAKALAAFQKTKLLAPGEAERLRLSYPVSAMASFDDTGKVAAFSYVLEAGVYRFFLGTSVRRGAYLPETLELSETRILETLESRCAPIQLPRRLLADGSYEELPVLREPGPLDHAQEEEDFTPPGAHSWPQAYDHEDRLFLQDVAGGNVPLEDFLAQLSDAQLLTMLGGQPNTGVGNCYGIGGPLEYGIPDLMTCDGPAGVRIRPECGVPTTAWPCATLVACSFSPELARALGRAGAEEAEENNLSLWLTPAMNIHRNPLCGRNFEYYSEDPYLTGTMAAGTIQGIQSRKVGATAKHLVCNNKEWYRKQSDSRVSQRALREIYLKGFEIALKAAKPLALMTSYNLLNGVHTSERRDLITGIVREEWGYEGLVVSDWWNSGNHLRELLAGNDVKMPKGDEAGLAQALASGSLCREDLLASARRVLEFALRLK